VGISSESRGLTFGQFLTNAWLPAKGLQLRPTTSHRYERMVTHYVLPRLGAIALRRLRVDVPRIRLHDLRHTHATLLIKDGEALKVVSERLGHANPAFTMTTYQSVLPGTGADAANRFARLVTSNVASTGSR
jgi:integrase